MLSSMERLYHLNLVSKVIPSVVETAEQSNSVAIVIADCSSKLQQYRRYRR